MIQIRKGIFETNSSSVHAIVVAKENKNIVTNQIVNFSIQNYGWAHPSLFDIDELASYFYTACCEIYSKDMQGEIRSMLPEDTIAVFCRPKFSTFEFDNKTYKTLDNGDIDHVDELRPWVEELLHNKDKFINYLFGDSFVIISNDNSPSEELEDFRKDEEYLKENSEIYVKEN